MGRTQRKIADIQPFAELAQSATTVVYKGYQQGLGRFVLLKVLRPGLGHDDERLRRFEDEARLVAQVQHPNVVAVYAAGRDDGQAYIAAEFVDGFDLRTLLAQRPLPPDLAVFTVLETARGLQAAHAHGILHRDLKPSNILIAHDGQVKLTDFGMASFLEEDAGAEVRGTPGYLAPELVRGEPPTKTSDLFSLGATFYEALAGRAAFVGEDTGALLDAVLHHDPLPRLERFTDLPADVHRICARLLAKDPSARYPDADTLIADLEAFRVAHGVTAGAAALKTFLEDPEAYWRLQRAQVTVAVKAEPAPPPEGTARPAAPLPRPTRRRVRWAWGLALAVLVVAGLGGSLLLRDEQPAPREPAETMEEMAAGLPEADASRPALPEETDTADADPTISRAAQEPEPQEPEPEKPEPKKPEALAPTLDDGEETLALAEEDTTANLAAGLTPPDTATNIAPDAAPGTLLVDVQPWADVYVDGDPVGRTPMTPLTFAAGTYRIALKHPQFPEYADEVTIRAGEEVAVRISLWDLVGRLSVEVSPWAVVVIDGVVRDTIPLEHPLIVEPGLRRLSLRHPDLGVFDTTFTIARGEAKTLRFRLKELIRR